LLKGGINVNGSTHVRFNCNTQSCT